MVKELSIVPRADYFDAVWVTKSEPIKAPKLQAADGAQRECIHACVPLNRDNVLSIDHGLDNWRSLHIKCKH